MFPEPIEAAVNKKGLRTGGDGGDWGDCSFLTRGENLCYVLALRSRPREAGNITPIPPSPPVALSAEIFLCKDFFPPLFSGIRGPLVIPLLIAKQQQMLIARARCGPHVARCPTPLQDHPNILRHTGPFPPQMLAGQPPAEFAPFCSPHLQPLRPCTVVQAQRKSVGRSSAPTETRAHAAWA